MANIVSAADILAETGGGLFYSKQDKESLHMEQRPFWVTSAIAEKDGNYGPQTIFAIREKNGNEGNLAFGVTADRIEIAKKISIAIANGADAVGPWYLGRWEKGNRAGWTMTHEPTTPREIKDVIEEHAIGTQVKKAAETSEQAKFDQDVPF